jgi:hypothetical protein
VPLPPVGDSALPPPAVAPVSRVVPSSVLPEPAEMPLAPVAPLLPPVFVGSLFPKFCDMSVISLAFD